MKNIKSIRTKIMMTICLLVIVSLTLIGTAVSILMYRSSMTQLEKTMSETANISAKCVVEYLETFKGIAKETGTIARLSNESLSISDKAEIIKDKVKQYNFVGGNITDTEGNGLITETNIADRDYFKAAMKGEAYISDILLSRTTQKYTINVAAPIWKDGKVNTTIVGVVYYNVDAERLSDITNEIQIGNTGSAYMLDKDNFTIAHRTIKVEDRDNTAESLKDDPKLKPLAEIEAKMCAGEAGFGKYFYGNKNKIISYAPVGLNGWSIAVNAELAEFIDSTIAAIIITVILVAIAICVGIILSIRLANSITKPVKELDYMAKELAEGKLDTTISHHGSDELGSLADNMRLAMSTLKAHIDDIDYSLTEFANGNFRLREFSMPFVGDFEAIKNAIESSSTGLSNTMQQIMMTSDQVASGSAQVSDGAQELSQGAAEQASSIEELSATINEISGQVKKNADNSNKANSMAEDTANSIKSSNEQMNNLMKSMSEIDTKSHDIGKIIKTIEDIAFQTNILALNAAVEAARAGSAGKGFAVVADEVRNLAGKSAEAAKNTTALIEDSVAAIAEGVKLAKYTAEGLDTAVHTVSQTTDIMSEIMHASNEQAKSISEITIGIDQISSVVQTNSATAEESAAASEELLGQASLLKELIAKFQLNN